MALNQLRDTLAELIRGNEVWENSRIVVVLFIDADGRIRNWRVVTSETLPRQEGLLGQAIGRMRLPAPPRETQELYRTVGIGLLLEM
jgi:hypothetical protein